MSEKEKHHQERLKHAKIFGKHTNWEVFKHNVFKLICVDMLSKSFAVLVGCLVFTIFFLSDQVYATGKSVEWIALLVAITPPSFFAIYWIEREVATNILIDIGEGIKAFFSNRK